MEISRTDVAAWILRSGSAWRQRHITAGYASGKGEPLAPHCHHALSLTFFSGRLRTGLPVAAWIAFSTAGAATQMVGSSTPPQKSWVDTITVSTLGNSARRMTS